MQNADQIRTNALPPLGTLMTLAWRNLWRNHRRTAIMLAAISVGVWAMIFMSALMRGMVDDMLKRGIDQLPGHVQIHNPQFLDDPSIVHSLPEPDSAMQDALNQAAVSKWFSRVKVPAMISSERESRGVMLLGIDPEAERETILNGVELTQGRFLESAGDRGVVLGEKLVQRLETRLGKRVVITSQDPQNNLAEIGLRVIGIYQAELRSQEEQFLFISKQAAQKLLNIEDQVSEVAVFGDDYRDIARVSQHVTAATESWNSRLPAKVEANPWQTINGFLSSSVTVMDGFVLIWIIVVFIALSFGLANTLVMAVFERVREIGLMLALGMRPALVTWQILLESVFLLLLGLLLGNILAVLSIYALADGIDLSGVAQGFEMVGVGNTLVPQLWIKDLLTANAVVILLGLTTSMLPAWRAANYDPVRALSKAT
ncbi:MAG: ABC transporter permease [Pseudomonadota bacterium]